MNMNVNLMNTDVAPQVTNSMNDVSTSHLYLTAGVYVTMTQIVKDMLATHMDGAKLPQLLLVNQVAISIVLGSQEI